MNRAAIALLFLVTLIGCGGGGKHHGGNTVTPSNNDPNMGGPPSGQDGSSCSGDIGCNGGVCLTSADGWPGGYCTTSDCKTKGCNGDEAVCIAALDGSSNCLDSCKTNLDCRAGYRCRTVDASGVRVCFRDDGQGPPPGEVGAECSSDADCSDPRTCDKTLPGGYCVAGDCGGCPDGGVCADIGNGKECVQACTDTRNCRTGYLCGMVDGASVCKPSDAVVPPFDFSVTRSVLGIKCNATQVDQSDGQTTWTIPYTIADGTTSYTLVPFVSTGTLRPQKIETPMTTIDLVNDYKAHNIRATEFQFFDQESQGTFGTIALDWPIGIPYAPKYQDLVVAGDHTLTLATSTAKPCLYVAQSSGGGTTLDLNVYFVGLDNLDAASAPSNPDLKTVFERVDQIYASAGISIGDVKYYDAPPEISQRYSFVTSQAELKRLTAFGAPRDETLRGHLNIDVFLVKDLSLSGISVLGLSAGLPGPPGMHGNPANGLVFTAADIGSDDNFVGYVMAHELGHYLGLRHTTEVAHGLSTTDAMALDKLMGTTDPIDDTPVCDSVIAQGPNCPDANNLMFPAALSKDSDPTISAGQATVMQASPLLLSPPQ